MTPEDEAKAACRAGLLPISQSSLKQPGQNPRYKLAIIRANERLADAIASRDRNYAEGDKAWGAYHEGRRQELEWMLAMLGEQQ